LNYLSFGSVYDPATLIEGVYALKAGHYLTWENGRVENVEYWDVGHTDEHELGSVSSMLVGNGEKIDAQVLSELRGVLEEAVALRLVSDVPVGVFLSGGIDSSVLTGLLSRSVSSRVNTFSIVFRESEYSEAHYSRSIAQRFHTDHHELVLSQQDALDALPDAIRAMDQPTMDGINTYFVSREARRAGLKVALSGLGGDEVFAGYTSFKTVPKMERFALASGHLPASVKNSVATVFTHLMPASDRNRKLATLIQGNGAIAHPYVLSRMLFLPDEQERLLKFLDPTSFDKASQPIAVRLRRAERFDPVNRVSYLELRNYMLNTLLRDTDFMSMAHGLEVRVPLIDHKLIEYLFTLPGALKIKGDTPKYLLIKATEGLLPEEVVRRPKRGFALPFEHWLRDELRRDVETALLGWREGPLAGVLNAEAVQGVWQAFLNGHTAWSRPWALYVLRRWCELYL
jgi:asparagine synthase (glutamine-hydrolysing)